MICVPKDRWAILKERIRDFGQSNNWYWLLAGLICGVFVMAFFGAIFSWKHIIDKTCNGTTIKTIDEAAILHLGPLGQWAIPYIYVALCTGAAFGVLILFVYYKSQKRLQESKDKILKEMEKYEGGKND